MIIFVCNLCGYEYKASEGCPDAGIEEGTDFDDLPEDWTCPYCGAHVDINHSAVCEYCNSVLTTDSFDWAVSNIKGIAQRSK